ncbi:MAG: FAD-dependent oxidoreductase [Anaerolineae bacterium]|jgi:heterodisulfide reductase subunit A
MTHNTEQQKPRIGVYVCQCGSNIAATVDTESVAEFAKGLDGVVMTRVNKYTCSDPGQAQIRQDIADHNLDRVVIAACTPRMHEPTFRRTLESAGLNPYFLEMTNIREQVSWVHPAGEATTNKAMDLVAGAAERVHLHQPLYSRKSPVEQSALVVGGGIAGIQSALDMADAGYQVYLVEREPTIGGKMAQLDKTFPTLDCAT